MTTTKPLINHDVESIATHIVTAIVTGHFAAGSNLPTEAQLAADFKVSRPTVRNALKKVSGKGLTSSRRGSGHKVGTWWYEASPDVLAGAVQNMDLSSSAGRTLVTDILDARTEMFALLGRQLCQRREEKRLYLAAEAIDAIRLTAEILPVELNVYEIYASAQHNIVLRMSLSAVVRATRALIDSLAYNPSQPEAYITEVRKIHQTIEMGMVEDAGTQIRQHFKRLDMEIRRSLLR